MTHQMWRGGRVKERSTAGKLRRMKELMNWYEDGGGGSRVSEWMSEKIRKVR